MAGSLGKGSGVAGRQLFPPLEGVLQTDFKVRRLPPVDLPLRGSSLVPSLLCLGCQMRRRKQGRLRRPEGAEASGLSHGHTPSARVGIPGADRLAGSPPPKLRAGRSDPGDLRTFGWPSCHLGIPSRPSDAIVF